MQNSSLLNSAPPLGLLLDALRRRIRRYIWLEAVVTMVFAAAAIFWVTLAIDWLFEPSPGARLALLLLSILSWIAVASLAIRRALVKLPDRSMAVLLERRFSEFGDSLLTSIELASPGEHFEYDAELFRETVREAGTHAREVDPKLVLRPGPLARRGAVALAAVVPLVALLVVAPFVGNVWASRMLLLSDQLWPRNTRLLVEGFEKGEQVVARGGDLSIIVLADASKVVPDLVEVRSTSEEGLRDRKAMIRVGEAKSSGEPFQHFRYTFQAINSTFTFDVVGGDDRHRGLRVRVVEPPVIERLTMQCIYPEYMARAERTIPVSAITQIPLGARVSLHARANKSLRTAELRRVDAETSNTPTTSPIALGSDARSFSLDFEPLDRDATLEFNLVDQDGVSNRAPIRIALNLLPDLAPEIQARPRGVGSAITSRARIPVAGKVTDDYGVRKAWLEYSVDGGYPTPILLRESDETTPEVIVETNLDVAEIATVKDLSILDAEPKPLAPGQKLSLRVSGEDAFQLERHPGPHVGLGEQFTWDIVSPEALRAILEAREMNLRLRFDQIIEEVTETRDTLAGLKLSDEATPSKVRAEPGEKAQSPASQSPEDRLARNHLRVQGALQAGRKNSDEILGVATSFDGIREELINNRLDSEELRSRLEDQISKPLKNVAGAMFSQFYALVQAFDAQLANAAEGAIAQRSAVAHADKIIIEMTQARDRMLELETFNEALDLLRGIVTSQEDLNRKTVEERRARARSLLNEDS